MKRRGVWPMHVFGAACVLLGLRILTGPWVDPLRISGRTGPRLLGLLLIVVGVIAVRAAAEHSSAVRRGELADPPDADPPAPEAADAPGTTRAAVRLGSPPRLGDDPFRDPPGPAPIVIIAPRRRPTATPITSGDPDDKPKLLT